MGSAEQSLVIVAYNMVPFSPNWGSCQRMYCLAEHLRSQDFSVHVVFCALDNYGDLGHPPRFQSYPRPIRSNAYHQFLGGKPAVSEPPAAGPVLDESRTRGVPPWANGARARGRRLAKHVIKRGLQWFYGFVSPVAEAKGRLWVSDNVEWIKWFVQTVRPAVVIISGPPFSLFRLAPCLKREVPGLPIVLDYRDPWTLCSVGGRPARRSEACALRSADLVIAATEKLREDLIASFHLPSSLVHTVLNGYSEATWKTVLCRRARGAGRGGMTISHVGSMNFSEKNGARDAFLEAFRRFVAGKNCLLRFVGVSGGSAAAIALKEKFGSAVEFIDMVSYERSLEYIVASDVVLLLPYAEQGLTVKYVIPQKFYDYLRSGRPMLGIERELGLFNSWIRTFGLGMACRNDVGEIQNALKLLFQKWEEHQLEGVRRDTGIRIEEFSRESQNSKYASLIAAVSQGRSGAGGGT